jgi:hypothetical protein
MTDCSSITPLHRQPYELEAMEEAERIGRKGESYKCHCARKCYAEGYKLLNIANSNKKSASASYESLCKVIGGRSLSE